jgi:hypothetical protein
MFELTTLVLIGHFVSCDLYKYILYHVTVLYKYILYHVTVLYKYILYHVTVLYKYILYQQSFLLVQETRVPGENHQPVASH